MIRASSTATHSSPMTARSLMASCREQLPWNDSRSSSGPLWTTPTPSATGIYVKQLFHKGEGSLRLKVVSEVLWSDSTPSFFSPARDQLKRHYNLKQFWLQVDLEDLSSFDSVLADLLQRNPSEYLPLVRFPTCMVLGGGDPKRKKIALERE